jgi:hypothetical protein
VGGDDHPLPGGHELHRRPGGLDHAERLVTEDQARPGSAPVRPSYICRSAPQIALEVIRIRASVGFSMTASSTSRTAT